jgi:pimeloyl-ACP methyl ester carboxylesterase
MTIPTTQLHAQQRRMSRLTASRSKKWPLLRITVFVLVLVSAPSLFAQGETPTDWGLNAYHLEDAQLGNIHYYVSANGIERRKPLLFIISGCRGLPTMLVVQCEDKSLQLGTVPPDLIHGFSDQYHVAFIGKAGTPFCDKVKVNEINPLQNLEDYQPSDEYIQKCGMEWEVQASSLVLDALCDTLPNTSNKVVVVGFSEGGHLAIKLAAESKQVTHLVSVISGGLNQFYSSIINQRMDAAMGKITHEEAQAEIDDLFATYREIYSDPRSTEKWYYGHPYRRWGSFCGDIPLRHLVKLEIPIFLLNGSADRNTPILQSDYVKLEFLRLGKDNLTYRVMPGCDHWFHEEVVNDGKEEHVSRRKEALKMIGDWVSAN